MAPIFFASREPIRIHVGHDDVPGPGVPDDLCRHDADRPSAGDQHVLAEQIELERGVHGVPERVEDRRHIAVDVRIVSPDVGHRQREVFGERARAIDADPLRILAEVAAACEAVAAVAADDVAFAADDLADGVILDVRADLDDPPHEFVADDHRHGDGLLGPGVPLIDVDVGAADAGAEDLDEDVIDADGRNRHLLQPEALAGFLLDEGLHGRLHRAIPFRVGPRR